MMGFSVVNRIKVRIQKWHKPPVFVGDEIKTRQAEVTNAATITVTVFTALVFVGNLLGGRIPLATMIIDIFIIGLCVVLYFILHKGWVKLAGVGMIAFGTIFVTMGAASLGTIRTPTTAVYLLVVVISGLLFGQVGVLVATTLSSLAIGGLVVTEIMGILPTPDYSVNVTQWITYTLLFGLTGSLLSIATRTTKRALARAEDELAERQKIEAALKESEAHYRRVSSTISDIAYSCMTDADGFVIDWLSGAVEQITGYTAEELKAMRCWGHLVIEEDYHLFEDFVIHVMPGNTGSCDLRIRRKDGNIRWINSYTECIEEEKGHRLYGGLVDISERKQAEDKLSESENLFKYVFNYSMVGMSITKPSGEVRVNKAFCNMVGYSLEEFGKRKWQEITHPDDIDLTQKEVDALLSGEKTFARFIKRFIHRNGSVVWVELSSSLRRDKDGRPLYLVTILVDITERKQAEDKLRENRKFLADLIEYSEALIFVKDKDGQYELVNRKYEELTGIPRQSIIGRTDAEIFPRDVAVRYRESDLQVMESGQAMEIEDSMDKSDGRQDLFTIKFPLHTDDGNVRGVCGMATDITERKRLETFLQARLELLEFAVDHPLDEFMQIALDKIASSTGSTIGFYHFVEPDQGTFSLQAWSTRTLQEFYRAEGKGLHYDMDQESAWVDCVRQHKPVIHNDYESLPASRRQELPPSHAPIIRELVVPVYRGEKVVSILGVGNKSTNYVEEDVNMVSYLADVFWEIVQRKMTEQTLSEVESRMHLLSQNLEGAGLYVYSHDVEGKPHFEYISASLEKLIGIKAEEALQNAESLLSTILPEYIPLQVELEQKSKESLNSFEMEICQKHAITGEIRWSWLRSTPRRRPDGSTVWYGVQMDITERKRNERLLEEAYEQLHVQVVKIEQLHEELREQALHDPLTGLYNRRYLSEALGREVIRTNRMRQPLSIIAIDIDRFKKVNDTYGHHVGDLFLKGVSTLIKNHARGYDFVCRYGGEEFLVVLPGASTADAFARADEIRQKCEAFIMLFEGKELHVTISVGIATYPDHDTDVERVVVKADQAMYHSKDAGRNRVTAWDENQ